MQLIDNEKAKLTDDMLDSVTGGFVIGREESSYFICKGIASDGLRCNNTDFLIVSATETEITVKCKRCGAVAKITQ